MTDPNHIAEARKKVSRPQIREVFLRNGAVIPADRDDLPDYVYEAAFELLEMAAPDVQGEPVHVECRQCDACGHVGIDDLRDDHAACHTCDWDGPEPGQDRCPGCGRTDCMAAACPVCGSRYVLRDTKVVTAPQPTGYNFADAMRLCSEGLNEWKAKAHNKRWWKRIDGTPIPNDLLCCIAEAFTADQPAQPADQQPAPDVDVLVEASDRAATAVNEHEEMKNAMQLAQGPMPTTLGELHDYLDSIRKSWSAQDTKYLGSYESQPLYILPNDPTPGFHLAKAKYFAEFGLTFIPVEGASK